MLSDINKILPNNLILVLTQFFIIIQQIPLAYSLPASNDTDDSSTSDIDSVYIVLVFSLFIIVCNIIGCLYIISRKINSNFQRFKKILIIDKKDILFSGTYIRWKNRSEIPMSLRFPYYLALTDVLLSIISLINHGYGVIYKRPLEFPACSIIGSLLVFSTSLSTNLVVSISVVSWLRVVRGIWIDFGKCDYKLWVVLFSIGSFYFAFIVRNVSEHKYWCAPDYTDKFFSILAISVVLLTLSIITYCYAHVLMLIKRADYRSNMKSNSGDNSGSNNGSSSGILKNKFERKVFKKILTYVLVFLIQYIPCLVYEVVTVMNPGKQENGIVALIALTAFNLGAVGNFFQYITNEGFSLKRSLSSVSNNESIPSREDEIELNNKTDIIE
ncbi:10495_t:CDS:2, partial [Entrophospora sp. SA101]